jgi:hypothetical protein
VRVILRCLLATELLLGTPLPSSAQSSSAQPPFDQSPQAKADRIGHTIDLLGSIRGAVAQHYNGQEVKVYKLVSVRLMICAGLYGVLAKQTSPSDDAAQQAAFAEAVGVYGLASASLYAGPPDQYQQDVSKAQAEVIKIQAEKDQPKILHLLRNCADLSTSSAVANAVADLIDDDLPDYIKPLVHVGPELRLQHEMDKADKQVDADMRSELGRKARGICGQRLGISNPPLPINSETQIVISKYGPQKAEAYIDCVVNEMYPVPRH